MLLMIGVLIHYQLNLNMGAQWLSGKVLDSSPRSHGFEPHRRHCVVSLNKTYLSLLSTGLNQRFGLENDISDVKKEHTE